MKKRNKIIAGLVIGGAIASVLGMKLAKDKGQDTDGVNDVDPHKNENKDIMLKPKRKGVILRLLDWLEKND